MVFSTCFCASLAPSGLIRCLNRLHITAAPPSLWRLAGCRALIHLMPTELLFVTDLADSTTRCRLDVKTVKHTWSVSMYDL